MKITEIFKSVLSEEKSEKDKKIFYTLDIDIAGDNTRFKAKGNGIINVPQEDALRLITVEDVIVYLIQEEARNVIKSQDGISGKDLLKEILVAFMDEKVNVEDYATRTDKILFSFDYGNDREDSAGVLVNKIENSSSFSVVMRYNGNAQNAKFNRDTIDKQIQYFSRAGE
jgi:hypothetical protein